MVAEVPTASLNLIDENRQCQLTTVGFEGADSPRDSSMCAIQFRAGRFVHVPDATRNPIYANNPWVTGLMADVRFYASAPLITPSGYALGTLCVFDDKVKKLRPDQVSRLLDLADVIVALFERRRQARQFAELAVQRERERRFIETVLETIDVGVVVADPRGRVTVFNRAAREWHGLGPEPELAPSDLPDRYGLFDASGGRRLAEDEVPLLRALRGTDVTGVEMMIKRPDLDPVQITCNARQLVEDDGTVVGAVVAMNDVTRDRATHRALEQAHADLADRGEQLAAAVVELRRSNEELEQFAGAVSHDLVRPMAAAHGYLEMLASERASSLDALGVKWLDAASSAVERMQKLVDALLSYARSGQAPYKPQPVDLDEVLRNVLADLRTITESSHATIDSPEPLPSVLGDPTLLRQLLQNVLDNAMKYRSPERECRIELTAVADGDHWQLQIADNGIGIPPDQRERVFEMFAQVDPAARKGHGIGLSTCQRIMERHGGTITLADTPGGGTTIRLRLPAATQ
ncbi:PAS domain-containing protein [Actinoplanes sp. TBRC 11911]|nr:PAS domain-containing protein [Actinoplanes sp. TBRC 11911]